ncbi:hypothetical protein KM043_001686 [Ampulex compressa]|nr:hypothetical protein KM043_001686 [Ampulex compressa]
MHMFGWTVFLMVTMGRPGSQEPTFFKNTFKGLAGVVPEPLTPVGRIRVVYYHEQTVAVVDLGPNNELLNCDLVEVYERNEAAEVLKNLSTTLRPNLVNLKEMTTLMQQCELLDKLQAESAAALSPSSLSRGNRVVVSSLTLLSGILPGTKWCGTGDIAENYHDLGQDAHIDRCCRTHDLCPVKVRAQQTRYNLTNYSIYTKSHCICDDALYKCLKAANHPTANIMGHIYFNMVKVPCIEDVSNSDRPPFGVKRRFISVKMSY